MPFCFAFAWLNAIRAVKHSHNCHHACFFACAHNRGICQQTLSSWRWMRMIVLCVEALPSLALTLKPGMHSIPRTLSIICLAVLPAAEILYRIVPSQGLTLSPQLRIYRLTIFLQWCKFSFHGRPPTSSKTLEEEFILRPASKICYDKLEHTKCRAILRVRKSQEKTFTTFSKSFAFLARCLISFAINFLHQLWVCRWKMHRNYMFVIGHGIKPGNIAC